MPSEQNAIDMKHLKTTKTMTIFLIQETIFDNDFMFDVRHVSVEVGKHSRWEQVRKAAKKGESTEVRNKNTSAEARGAFL